MRRNAAAAFMACVVITAAGASSADAYQLNPAPSQPNVGVRYDRGVGILLSRMAGGAVRVQPLSDSIEGGRLDLSIVAFNLSAIPANLGLEDVTVTYDNGAPMRLYGYEEIRQDAKNRANWRKATVALMTGGILYGAYRAGDDGTVSRDAARQASNQWNAISDQLDREFDRLNGVILRTTTIDPGGIDGGYIRLDKPVFNKGLSPRIDLSVRFNGEIHHFSFYAIKDGAQLPLPASGPAVDAPATNNPFFAATATPVAPAAGNVDPYGQPSDALMASRRRF